jgi:hypothetical protein
MTARPGMIAVQLEEPHDIDLARLDDDGGSLQAPRQRAARHDGAYGFAPPMIPGAREPGILTRFAVPAVAVSASPCTMDAATIAARQREGGGAPSERRPAPQGSSWTRLSRTLRRLLIGADRS